jgi:hypothetical protein
MTLSTTTNKAVFEGTGTTGPFPFLFPFTDDSEISVFTVLENVAMDIDDSGYTLTGAGDPDGGSVTTIDIVPEGTTLVVMRVLALDQTTDLVNQGPFYAETHEDTFDRLAMQIQQLKEEVNRCLRMPKGMLSDQELSADRAGCYLGFDTNGNVIYTPTVQLGASSVTVIITSAAYEIPGTYNEIVLINGYAGDAAITDEDSNTINRLSSAVMTVQDEVWHLVKAGTNWYKIG